MCVHGAYGVPYVLSINHLHAVGFVQKITAFDIKGYSYYFVCIFINEFCNTIYLHETKFTICVSTELCICFVHIPHAVGFVQKITAFYIKGSSYYLSAFLYQWILQHHNIYVCPQSFMFCPYTAYDVKQSGIKLPFLTQVARFVRRVSSL